MKIKTMRLLTACLWFFCGFAVESYAANIYAKSPSYSDVSSSVLVASPGDTVVVPAGNATWDKQLYMTKGVKIIGGGSTSTIITAGAGAERFAPRYLIYYQPTNPTANEDFRISGFTFNLDNKCGFLHIRNVTASPINKIRIDHNNVENVFFYAILTIGTIYGVIDSNHFMDGFPLMTYGADDISWNTFTFNFGSADNLYIEDNIFHSLGDYHLAGVGGRQAYRYNTYISYRSAGLYPWFDMHGNQPGGNYATMGGEYYGNVLTHANNYGVSILDQRAGKAVVFGNNVKTSGAVSSKVREEYDDSLYPDPNSFLQHVTDSYYWNNRKNSTQLIKTIIVTAPDCINGLAENVDFFNHNPLYDGVTQRGVFCGSSLPVTCTVGDGAWISNQSCSEISDDSVGANPKNPISGTLYKCTEKNTWTAFYTPYTYPHPLRKTLSPPILHSLQ